MTRPSFEIFISYAHEDEPLKNELVSHLRVLERQGFLVIWHDREVLPGIPLTNEIDRHLESANLVLLLISSDFFASDYCWGKEMKRALERRQIGDALVIPVIIRDCIWQTSPIGKLLALPEDGIPITDLQHWGTRDTAFVSVVNGILSLLQNPAISLRANRIISSVSQSERPLTPTQQLRDKGVVPTPHRKETVVSASSRHLSVTTSDAIAMSDALSELPFPKGGYANGLILHGNLLFCANWDQSSIDILNIDTMTFTRHISMDAFEVKGPARDSEKPNRVIRHYPPGEMTFTDGKLFVGQIFSDFILVIDVHTWEVVKRLSIGGEGHLAVSPDGKEVYFASNKSHSFYIINTETYDIVEIPFPGTGRGSGSLAVSPDGNQLLLGIQRGGNLGSRNISGGNCFLAIFDLRHRTYTKTVYLAELLNESLSDDSTPISILYSPDNSEICIGMFQSRKGIYILDASTFTIKDNIAFEPNSANRYFPWVDPLSLTMFGDHLVSVNRNNYELAIIDIATRRIVSQVHLGGSCNGPQDVVVKDTTALISHAEYPGLLLVDLEMALGR